MIIGVSRGFVYKLRLVYAHFPININYHHDKQLLEIRNYYGEKRLISFYISRRLQIILSESQDKEISLYSKDIETLGLISSLISNACSINNKDPRIFLDGIYTAIKKADEC
mmetsp:Transcript_5493/g.13378  ORF Transcript_5493/g.13378 Transcript_5493/m.13378 type:complete len:111 (-) Transcript_5493:752-1084(-)